MKRLVLVTAAVVTLAFSAGVAAGANVPGYSYPEEINLRPDNAMATERHFPAMRLEIDNVQQLASTAGGRVAVWVGQGPSAIANIQAGIAYNGSGYDHEGYWLYVETCAPCVGAEDDSSGHHLIWVSPTKAGVVATVSIRDVGDAAYVTLNGTEYGPLNLPLPAGAPAGAYWGVTASAESYTPTGPNVWQWQIAHAPEAPRVPREIALLPTSSRAEPY